MNAYRVLANEGQWREPRFTLDGTPSPTGRQVFSREAAYLVSDILSDREARSITFGFENPLATRFWTAVKTGTSKDMRDNWCVGYSRGYTVGVWIGNFSGEAMWNVSGVTGAAPLWAEMMDLLHRQEPSRGKEPPPGVVSRPTVIHDGKGGLSTEWFIRGTEPNSRQEKLGQANCRILYPLSETVFALDPDIPPELQRIFFVFQGDENAFRCELDGVPLASSGKTAAWAPRPGRHHLVLAEGGGKILDYVYFEVRAPVKSADPRLEDIEEAFSH